MDSYLSPRARLAGSHAVEVSGLGRVLLPPSVERRPRTRPRELLGIQ